MAGDYPRVIKYKLETFYRESGPAGVAVDETAIPIDGLLSRLATTALPQMTIEKLAEFFVDMGRVAGTGRGNPNDLRALRPLNPALSGATDLNSELLHRGLDLLLDESAVICLPGTIHLEEGADSQRQAASRMIAGVAQTLETQLSVRMAGLERAHRMVITGVVELVKGADPKQVGRLVREVAA